MSMVERASFLPASLAGRCSNGHERGQGPLVHAVPRSTELERNDYCITSALCGAKPGPRSAGWSHYGMRAVTCPRCAARYARLADGACSANQTTGDRP